LICVFIFIIIIIIIYHCSVHRNIKVLRSPTDAHIY